MDGVQLPQGCSHFEEAVYWESSALTTWPLNFKFSLLFQGLIDFILLFKRNMEKNIYKTVKILLTSQKYVPLII